MKFNHVMFDFDGTLVDSAPCILSCFQQVLDALKITPKVAITDAIIGPPLPETLQLISGKDDVAELESMAAMFKQFYDVRVAEETPPYPSVIQMLEQLKAAGVHMYIATNKRFDPTIKIITHLGWLDYFVSIRAVDQLPVERRKKASLIADMISEYQLAVDDVIYIGDKQDDRNAAHANNVTFAAALWGYGDWHDESRVLATAAAINNHILLG